ncbi:hypothetical protein GCM10017714_01530 [Curtobacterium pusillum]|uniref:DUF3800 domain-containing protein n=1 Tax=Curtobacterium pusillum TaxID=69373 RepID=A0ABX2MBA0_9MICO|nr:DUF3800 domain-containing protein [Curtobacterium pusillum]NUU15312.1 hypothetical protein [Curtobacterium pusillum]GLK31354.1 hypothetical protein GCM10017610_16390 [Curtobacterium pusillum]
MQRAYVDESEPGGGRDNRSYLIAAVVVTVAEEHDARRAVEALRPARMRKLHWYEALPTQRFSWLDLLRRAVEILVIRYDGAPARPERRRRRCLERLVFELDARGVRHLVLESRGPHADRGDRRMLDAIRGSGLGRSLRHEHVRGADEPLLALADIACGAHGTGALRDDDRAQEIVVA